MFTYLSNSNKKKISGEYRNKYARRTKSKKANNKSNSWILLTLHLKYKSVD